MSCGKNDAICNECASPSWLSMLENSLRWLFPKVKKENNCCVGFTIKEIGGDDEEERILEKAYAMSREYSEKSCKIVIRKTPLVRRMEHEKPHPNTPLYNEPPPYYYTKTAPSTEKLYIVPGTPVLPHGPRASQREFSVPPTPSTSRASTTVATRSVSRTAENENDISRPPSDHSIDLDVIEHVTLAINKKTGNAGKRYGRSPRRQGPRYSGHASHRKHRSSAKSTERHRRPRGVVEDESRENIKIKKVTFADETPPPKSILKRDRIYERKEGKKKVREAGSSDSKDVKYFVKDVHTAIDNIHNLMKR